MLVEILKQCQVNSRLYMPGINKPDFPEPIARKLIEAGNARAWPPEPPHSPAIDPQLAQAEERERPKRRKQRVARDRMQKTGVNRGFSSDSEDDDQDEDLSAAGLAPGQG